MLAEDRMMATPMLGAGPLRVIVRVAGPTLGTGDGLTTKVLMERTGSTSIEVCCELLLEAAVTVTLVGAVTVPAVALQDAETCPEAMVQVDGTESTLMGQGCQIGNTKPKFPRIVPHWPQVSSIALIVDWQSSRVSLRCDWRRGLRTKQRACGRGVSMGPRAAQGAFDMRQSVCDAANRHKTLKWVA